MKKSPTGSMEPILAPEDTDILFGRGGHVNHHPANQRYLELISERKSKYNNCKKVDKANIAWEIITELREQNPTPRFLRKDYSTGLWHIVKDNEVRRKISQCLRERAMPVINSTKKKSRRKPGARSIKPALVPAARSRRRIEKSEVEAEDPNTRVEESSQTGVAVMDTGVDPSQLGRTTGTPTQDEATSAVAVEMPPPVTTDRKTTEVFLQDATQQQQQRMFQAPSEDVYKVEHDQDIYGEGFVPPPMPVGQPLGKTETSSSRVWSDFFTGSFASFTPSILDAATGAENAWENLLDPSSPPKVCSDPKDDGNFPEACLMSDEDEESICGANETIPIVSHSSSSVSLQTGSHGHGHQGVSVGTPPPHQWLQDTRSSGGACVDLISVDAFFNCEMTSIGKVLEQSRFLTRV